MESFYKPRILGTDLNHLLNLVATALDSHGIEHKLVDVCHDTPNLNKLHVIVQLKLSEESLKLLATALATIPNASILSSKLKDNYITFEKLKVYFILALDSLEFRQLYYSYNRIGKLLDRTARIFGLRLTETDLRLYVRDTNIIAGAGGPNSLGYVVVTTDVREALKLLGYNPEIYSTGFTILYDSFEFILSGKYFSPDLFSKDLPKVRYQGTFYNYLKFKTTELKVVANCMVPSKVELLEFLKSDSTFNNSYNRVIADHNTKKLLYSKFNKLIVENLTKLKGENLGKFMSSFRQNYNVSKLSKSEVIITIENLIDGIKND